MKTKFKNTCLPVKPGDLLLTEQPFAYVLSSEQKGIRCDSCLGRGKVLKCSGCQFVHYCGRECQREAWNEHKWECSNLKRVSPKVIPDAARMMAKIIHKLSKSNGLTYQAYYTANSFRMWKDLMSHYSDLKADKKRMDHFTTLAVVLNDFLKDTTTVPNTVELLGLYGRMVINSFTILDVDMNSIGTGVYLGASIIDHSCNPNAVATFDGKTIYIRATEHMPTLDWKQVRISYLDLMKTPWERQTELMETYYFLCQCDRCLDEKQLNYLHGAKCPNTKCEKPISIEWKENCELVIREQKQNAQNANLLNGNTEGGDDVTQNCNEIVKEVVHCNDCGTKMSERQIESFRNVMEFTELHLQNMKHASISYVDVCKYCLEKQQVVLHPLNVMFAQTLDHAFDAFIQMQLWKQACECAVQLLPCFKYYYGDFHPLVGLLHLKYGKILLLQNNDLGEANKQLRLSQEIIKVTHGEIHPLYREELLPLLAEAMMAWQCDQ